MGRWLLNNFPLWVLAIGFVIVPASLAYLGARAGRRWLPSLTSSEVRETGSVVLAATLAVYGIVLAFVIVNQYTDFASTRDEVQSEALNIEDLYRAAQGFSQPTRSRLEITIADYVHTVVLQEWDELAHGGSSLRAGDDLDRLYTIMTAYRPTNPATVALYQEGLGFLHDAHVGRHHRIDAAIDTLPPILAWFLIVGAIATVVLSYMLGLGRWHHLTVPVGLACLLGFTLLLSMKLDYPFSGSDRIPTRHFTEGTLGAVFRTSQSEVLGPQPPAPYLRPLTAP